MIRADRTDEVISFLNAHKMGEVTLYPIWPVHGNPANRIIISARKNSKTGSILLPGITLHNTDGSLTSNASLAMKGLGIER
jgi:tRNA1(Val) A37 N6-methylase TrmN6